MKTRWILFAAAMASLTACVHVPETYARVECACPKGAAASYILSVHTPTGKWGVSGHAMAAYRETAWISIRLPELPAGRSTYQPPHVAVLDDGYGRSVPLTTGSVIVDRDKHEVVLALKTNEGDFWANGSYSLKTP